MTQTLVWGASSWIAAAAAITVLLLALLAWGYWITGPSRRLRLLAAGLKAIAIIILALCLLEPLVGGNRIKPGANQFIILMDNSGSMTLRDRDTRQTRGAQLKSLAGTPSPWLSRLAVDFDVRQYSFDTQLRAVPDVDAITFDGGASNLGSSLDRVVRRYHGRPLAGIILLSDGNATDPEMVDRFIAQSRAAGGSGTTAIPPIYPVVLSKDNPAADLHLDRVSVTQTNFEDAPVTLTAQIGATGYKGKTVSAELQDESGRSIERQQVVIADDSEPQTVRFRIRPENAGVTFYRVHVTEFRKAASQPATTAPADAASDEATLANNTRMVAVDRGQGPYRVLYVTGRPNWEFKFLRRAIQSDDQVQLVGLIRVAKREPKFTFLGHQGEATNPLFRGFDNKNKDDAEQYDQPVLVRLSTEDENELRGGFPKTAEELYRYNAIILDDLESEFFTTDQMALLKEFVRQRGGGLLMLGGQESFKNGKYDRTPIGDLLPVYLDEAPVPPVDAQWRMELTREGWLEPWMRLRSEEDAERQRLGSMPVFGALNTVRGIKPGATILARAQTESGTIAPALVEQRFGRGRTAALLIGDLWRWDLRRPANAPADLERAWRQTVRWLVSDVPRRVEMAITTPTDADATPGTLRFDVHVRDPAYLPQDNSTVAIKLVGPDGKNVELRAEASSREAGLYQAHYVPRSSGAYRVEAKATGADGAVIATVNTGWTTDPAAEEYQRLAVNRELLDRLAKATGGESVAAADLDSFVGTLPARRAPITEPYIRPLWHQAWVFLLVITCLTAEWGLRRWKGLV